jgi:two-component system chemotaxis sensor kinase CheA
LGVGHDHRYALPISQVTRLEKIPSDSIEWADHREVVQYRGEILPLTRLSQVMGVSACESADDLLDVVVFSHGGNSVGLVVDQICDIVETEVTSKLATHRPEIAGSAVIGGRVTDLLDIQAIVRSCDSLCFMA